MQYNHNAIRKNKQKVHELVLTHCPPIEKNGCVLFFPGEQATCWKTALKLGCVKRNTPAIFVEAKGELVSKLYNHGAKKAHISSGQLSALSFVECFNSMRDRYWRNNQFHYRMRVNNLQFGYFDLCGQMNRAECLWLVKNQGFFADNASIVFTLMAEPRQRTWYRKVKNHVNHCPLLNDIDCSKTNYIGNDMLSGKPIHKASIGLVGLKLTWLCLYWFDITLEAIKRYQDTKTPMVTFVLQLKRRSVLDLDRKNIVDKLNLSQPFSQPEPEEEPMKTKSKNKKSTVKSKNRPPSGVRPPGLSPAQWAWHPNNPNGIRNK